MGYLRAAALALSALLHCTYSCVVTVE